MILLPTKIQSLFLLIPLLILFACKPDEEVNIVYPKGGYLYLKNITAKDSDFYFLPIRSTLTRKDSFWVTPGLKDLFKGFDEKNLSIEAPKEDIFRFIYDGGGMSGKFAIIKLTKDKIEIKVPKSGAFFLAPDKAKLNSIEKMHFDLLYGNYPLEEEIFSERKKRHIDSLIRIYPELLAPIYYQKLLDKVFSVNQDPFEYSKKEIQITNDKFKYFVDLINNSEFWQRPYHSKDHEASFADGYAFFLEAITKKKYQCIMSNMYLDGPSKFRRVFDELVKYVKIDTTIHWETYEEFLNRPVEKIEVKELKLTEAKSEPQVKKKKAK